MVLTTPAAWPRAVAVAARVDAGGDVGLIAFGGWRYAQVNRELATASAPTVPAAPRVIYALAALLCLALLQS